MSSQEMPHLNRLLTHTPRMPVYLRGAVDQIMARCEKVPTVVSHFLHKPVQIGSLDTSRHIPEAVDPGAGDIFDVVDLYGNVAMRVTMTAATIATVTHALFGGDVTERPVLSGIGLSFCRQIAGALISEVAEPTEDDETPPDPLADYRIIKAETDAIGTRPVLRLKMQLALVQPPPLDVTIDFPRPFTDELSRPEGSLGSTILQLLSFPITAIAGHTAVPFGEIRQWKPGSEIQLPGAELTKMRLQVSTGPSVTTLAEGELGALDGMKSIRINAVSAGSAMDGMMAAG